MQQAPESRDSRIIRIATHSFYIFTGIFCCILGVTSAIGLSIYCIFGGIFSILTGIFVLLIEAPFCCAFIPQVDHVTRITDKMGPLSIGIACGVLGIVILAMCQSISTGFAFLLLLMTAGLRIREYILLRRARAQASAVGAEGGGAPPPYSTTTGTNAYPATPAYGGDPMMDRMVAGAARGAVQAAINKPPVY